jgi:integrase
MTGMKNSVRQRANGTWEGRYYGADGKQHSVYGSSKNVVKEKLAAKRTEISQGVAITETDLTVEQWGREWLDNFKANRVKHSTMDNYDTYFRLHIAPYIGHIKVKDLTTLTVQRLYNQLEKKGMSAKSVYNVHGMLHGMLDKAVKLNLLHQNVSKNCELPRFVKHEMYPLNKDEVGQFMGLAEDDQYYLMMRLDFFTGLRESELIGLSWDCVDFDKHTLRVYRQFVRIASGPDKGKMMYMPLKNGKERTITLTTSALNVLKEAKRRQSEMRLRAGSSWENEHNMIFTRENGRFVRFKTLYIHFKAIVKKMGRPEVRFHDIRHTFATLSLQSHVDPKTLSEALGHATVAFTLDVYGHCNEDMKQQAADKLEQLICQ